jgi:large subunit ribosomal protein L27
MNALRGATMLASRQPPSSYGLQSQVRGMATKKAGGSTSNGRDSAGRRLGIKVWPNMYAKAGSILVRQRGHKFLTGENVGMGRDHTLFAKTAGIVRMTRSPTNRKRNFVHVDAIEELAVEPVDMSIVANA